MSQKNDFKAFSISNNANVVSQEGYEESRSLKTGFPPENITTHLLNKVLRQSSTITSVVANFIATYSGNDVLDDGDVAKLIVQLNRALEQKIAIAVPSASLTQKGVTQLTNTIGNSNTLAVTQKLVSDVNDNANNRLAKNQNGADIPDKNAFVKNLGLSETVELAKNAVSANGGDYPQYFRFKQVETLPTERNATMLVSAQGARPTSEIVGYTLYNWYDNYIKTGIVRGGSVDTYGYTIDINGRRVFSVSPEGLIEAASANINGNARFKQVETIPNERNAVVLASESGGRPAGTIVSYTLYNWYDNYAKAGIVRGGSVDTYGYSIDINGRRVFSVSPAGQIEAASANIRGNAGVFNITHDTGRHAYFQFIEEAKRTAYIGFPSDGSSDFDICNEKKSSKLTIGGELAAYINNNRVFSVSPAGQIDAGSANLKGAGGIFNIVYDTGRHAYFQFVEGGKRTAYIGVPGDGSSDFDICNEKNYGRLTVGDKLKYNGNPIAVFNDNCIADTNGNLKVSSPVVNIHPDGTYELTREAEGMAVERIETGKYRISGCNGFAKDGAWGIHGGTIVPADSNGLNLIWVCESVDPSNGNITIECYHRQNKDAPIFAQNKRVKSVNGDGEVIYYNDGELCDIPDGRVINVRVQRPEKP
ncbi:phage tail protein [Photorhabdus noenieputensis]|uniref:phage tail protein n=1 Tax=Photorhabdus noenieputensis TaxID=1208607 RepID=UPI001BD56F43|nr:phage tail protein [Photorhabdus noenieputensis]MBS9437578.1 phage tail protein [Photorhabdus noenieputensis]MCK3670648.1 phage tail protein [Photorhabdus noenieputensis]